MQIYEMEKQKDRESAAKELLRFEKLMKKTEQEFQKLLSWQIKYCKEIVANKNGYEDRVITYGTTVKFIERIDNPSPVMLNEVYDIENDVKKIKQEGYEIIGGLGGFSFNNGRDAGELVFLPGGTAIRTQLENGSHYSMMVAPMNIYPQCILTARKTIDEKFDNKIFQNCKLSNLQYENDKTNKKSNQMIIIVFEKGDDVKQGIQKISELVGDSKKTITGVISGSFTDLKGYIFSGASPKTVLTNFQIKENKNMFFYQTLLGKDVKGFKRVVHTHGYEAAKFGEPHSFGAHVDDAIINIFAIGVFSIIDKVEQK
ncbi:MAG: hypothetical protein Q7S22_04040 [Candidatus Micrarchaeota archaeon]|nr:hypothetical protein [Candidatus Micrarchaeota archaeon]